MTAPPGDVVTSPQNARVAAARKLLLAKERAAARRFLVEGPHAVAEALSSGVHQVEGLFVTPGAARRDVEVLRTAAAADVTVTLVDDRVASRLSDTQHPQGIVAVVRQPRNSLSDVLASAPRLLVVLDKAADPGNVGTIIRTADAAGADAVVLTRGSADPYAGKVVRASAGSLFHLPVVTGLALSAVLAQCREAGLAVLAATLDGAELPDVPAEVVSGRVAWLFGSEAHGLPADVVAGADHRIRVPIYGRAESLNLAAAVAVCVYASATPG